MILSRILTRYTYGFFAQTAELVGPECAGLLPRLLPFLLASLNAEDAFDWQVWGIVPWRHSESSHHSK